MNNKYLIGVDLGTSGVKTVLFNQNGNIIATDTKTYNLYTPQENFAEQKCEEWKKQTLDSLRDLLKTANVENNDILGLGVSGQMHGLVLLDKGNNPVRDVIIWCDGRATKEAAQLKEMVGEDKLMSITGNKALPALTASKLLWVKNNEKDKYQKIAHFMLPKDYINFVLTNNFRCEPSDSSGTQLFDIKKQEWSKEIIDKFELDLSVFPEIIPSNGIVGQISKEVSQYTGLPETCVVVGGAADQPAAALGNGVVSSNTASCSFGSSGVIFLPSDSPVIDKSGALQTFCHCVKNTWTMMGVTQGCGISMSWLKNTFYKNEEKPYDVLNVEARNSGLGANKVLFLPYIMGERSPILDNDARGVFYGLRGDNKRDDLARSVFEGINFSLYHCMEKASEYTNLPSKLYLAGGGAKSELWISIFTDIANKETAITNSVESGALGVAILAGVATKLFSNEDEAVKQMIKEVKSYKPNQENHDKYMPYYSLYKDLYLALKPTFKQLKSIR